MNFRLLVLRRLQRLHRRSAHASPVVDSRSQLHEDPDVAVDGQCHRKRVEHCGGSDHVPKHDRLAATDAQKLSYHFAKTNEGHFTRHILRVAPLPGERNVSTLANMHSKDEPAKQTVQPTAQIIRVGTLREVKERGEYGLHVARYLSADKSAVKIMLAYFPKKKPPISRTRKTIRMSG